MRRFIPHGVLPLLIVIVLWGCSDNNDTIIDPGGPPVLNTATCLGCHASESELKASLGSLSRSDLPPPSLSDG